MKKTRLLSLCLAVCLLATLLVGCGSEKFADSPYVGEWAAGTCSYMGMEFDTADIIDGGFSILLDAGGKATAVISGESSSGKWEPTEDGIRLYGLGDEMFFSAGDDGTLVLDYSDMILTFTR